jgi:hypothetical protein
MCQSIRFLPIGILLIFIPSAVLAQDNPFQGIYAGRMRISIANRGAGQPDFYSARLTVLPDGHSIIITAQLPNSVSTWVCKGSFNGNLFEGSTRGRFNGSDYVYANHYEIRFLQNEARLTGGPINPLPGQHPQRIPIIFKRIRS